MTLVPTVCKRSCRCSHCAVLRRQSGVPKCLWWPALSGRVRALVYSAGEEGEGRGKRAGTVQLCPFATHATHATRATRACPRPATCSHSSSDICAYANSAGREEASVPLSNQSEGSHSSLGCNSQARDAPRPMGHRGARNRAATPRECLIPQQQCTRQSVCLVSMLPMASQIACHLLRCSNPKLSSYRRAQSFDAYHAGICPRKHPDKRDACLSAWRTAS